MEILKHGNVPRVVATCPHCGCVVSFLESEATLVWDDENYIRCPECNSVIREVYFERKS